MMDDFAALARKNDERLGSMTRAERLRRGLLDPADLTDEECARGVVMNEDGTYPGVSPRRVPRVMFEERLRRLFDEGDRVLQSAYLVAVRALHEIVSDPNVAHGDRLRAIAMVQDRVRGREVVTVKVQTEDPLEQLVRGILADPEGLMEPVPVPIER